MRPTRATGVVLLLLVLSASTAAAMAATTTPTIASAALSADAPAAAIASLLAPHPPVASSTPLPPPSPSGRSAARRRALLQASAASASVSRTVNCSALPGLQACAEPLCFESFELRRNATSGSVECRPIPPASPAALNLAINFYDGDYIFLSTGDNALAAASVVDNTNTGRRFSTREGSLRLRAPFTERTRNVGSVFGGWLGRFSQRRASVEGASSWSVGTNGQRPLQTEASLGTVLLPKVAATVKQGFYGPGFTALGRGAAASTDPKAQEGSVEGNVALDVTAPFGIGGRRRRSRSRRALLQEQDRQEGDAAAAAAANIATPPEEGRAADKEDLDALRAQLRRLVAKGAIKGDAIFGLKKKKQEEEDSPAAAAAAADGDGGAGEPRRLRTNSGGGGGGGGGSSSPSPSSPSSDLAPALLPFCRPRLGLMCSDTDLLRVLRKARPDAVLLSDDSPAWAEAFGTAELDPRVLLRTDPIAGPLPAASLVGNAKLDGRLGVLPANAALKSTLASTMFGVAPAPYASVGAAPALAFTMGQSRGEATLEAREARARLVVFPGANFGSLAGLTTVEATQG